MNNSNFPPDYFEHNSFKQIDDALIRGGQILAEKAFTGVPFKASKKNCVIVYKQNDNLYSHVKRDYESSIKQAKKLMEQGINSIIYIFTNYPKIVKHHIVSESRDNIPDYEGKGRTFEVDVSDVDTSEPFNPSNN